MVISVSYDRTLTGSQLWDSSSKLYFGFSYLFIGQLILPGYVVLIISDFCMYICLLLYLYQDQVFRNKFMQMVVHVNGFFAWYWPLYSLLEHHDHGRAFLWACYPWFLSQVLSHYVQVCCFLGFYIQFYAHVIYFMITTFWCSLQCNERSVFGKVWKLVSRR